MKLTTLVGLITEEEVKSRTRRLGLEPRTGIKEKGNSTESIKEWIMTVTIMFYWTPNMNISIYRRHAVPRDCSLERYPWESFFSQQMQLTQ